MVAKLATYFDVPVDVLVYGDSVVSAFWDPELKRLFHEVDEMGRVDRDLVKRYARKVIRNSRDRTRLEREVEN